MRSTIFIAITMIIGFYSNLSAQRLLESRLTEAQAGILGAYFHQERLVSKRTTADLGLGLDGQIISNGNGTLVMFVPVLSAEPKFYYNINKREAKGKRVDNNSANYFSLDVKHHPNWFVLSNGHVDVIPDLSLLASWGLRRAIGQHFSFQFAVGFGRYWVFDGLTYSANSLELKLRFGYVFSRG